MKTIAVIFGGRTAEHDVSIVTAIASIIKPLKLTDEFRVEPVYIAKDGSWYWDDKLADISLYQGDGLNEFLAKASKVHLLFDNGLTLVKSSQFAGRKMYRKIDIVFPAMHGTYGEDGALMGLLDMAGVPYVGCGVSASAVAMDKVLTKLVTQAAGIPSTPWVWFKASELAADPVAIMTRIKHLKYPLFVKPALLGSSIGITRVTDPAQLMNALEVATHYDDKVLVEQGVNNLIEVTLPVIGNDTPRPALLEQPLTKPDDFFDFDTKYLSGGGKKMGGAKQGAQGYSKIPADLPRKLYDEAQELALATYRTVGCTGIARIDLLIDGKTNEVFLNEINPLPGSLYAHNWRQAGLSNHQLVVELIRLAEERHTARARLQTSFSTNFLKQF
ncbi:MAG TPA: D-alanine--D-alanine ligase family protein [Candidatus Saccharimonadia bacterium]|jgi:D-alanine-D-alanine ligase|nr:D-alanine--D-alanine ligase family protein [Candidatus Saccharimonadia bacterium]